MVTKTVARNQTQKISTQVLNGNRNIVGVTTVTLLTVGADKKIEIIGIANRAVSFGTNTLMDINIGGRRLRRATVADVGLVDIPQGKGQMLEATQTITLTGDGAGDNGSVDFMISFRETAA